jgi:hypothetical protein
MNTLDDIRAKLAAIPDPDTTPGLSPAQARELDRQRRLWDGVLANVTNLVPMLAERDAQIAEQESWRDLLLAFRKETADVIVKLLAEKAALTDRHEQRRIDERLLALTASIRAVDRGIEYVGPHAMLPTPLNEWLLAHGVTPKPGQTNVWNGRGSIAQTQQRLLELRDKRNELQARIDAALSTVDKHAVTV